MSKMITRTFTVSNVTITNSITNENITEYKVIGKVSKKKIMKDYLNSIESDELQPILIEVKEEQVKRGMEVEKFLEMSEVIEEENK